MPTAIQDLPKEAQTFARGATSHSNCFLHLDLCLSFSSSRDIQTNAEYDTDTISQCIVWTIHCHNFSSFQFTTFFHCSLTKIKLCTKKRDRLSQPAVCPPNAIFSKTLSSKRDKLKFLHDCRDFDSRDIDCRDFETLPFKL